VITRNNPAPVLLAYEETIKLVDEPSNPIGLYRDTRPVINEVSLEKGLTTVIFTDGMIHAGSRYGQDLDIVSCLECLLEEEDPTPQLIADELIQQAIQLDHGRPSDDISVVVLRATGNKGDNIRRMSVRLPIST